MIPVYALHRDEKFYSKPDEFDPTRFTSHGRSRSICKDQNSNEKVTVDKPPYLPFGDGPRACIGMRMAKMLIKVGVAAILQKCFIELGDELDTEHEFQFTPIGAFLRPPNGMNLQFKTRKVVMKSTQRIDFLDLIEQFSPGESEFSRAVRMAQPMRPIPKIQRPNFNAHRKRMSLR